MPVTQSIRIENSGPFQSIFAKDRTYQDEKKTAIFSKKWFQLVPVIATIALGAIFSPTFVIGMKVGLLYGSVFVVPLTTLVAIVALTRTNPSNNKETNLPSKVFYTCIGAPIVEEIIFRGGIQTSIKLLARHILPLMTLQFCVGPPVALATVVAVVATSALFGFAHLYFRGSGFNALYSGMTGLVDGALMINYGLAAAIGSHVANNTLVFSALTVINYI